GRRGCVETSDSSTRTAESEDSHEETVEEQEPPIDDVHEEIHRRAEGTGARWVSGVALSAAILAALAAVASLLSGHHANEATLEQLRASDQWAYYQAKGIKAAILSAKIDVLQSVGKQPADADRD